MFPTVYRQVAVDHSFLVRRLERIRDLDGDPDGLVDRDWSERDAIGQRGTFHELEDECSTGLPEPVDTGDIGVAQYSEELCFSSEPRGPIRIRGKAVRQDFERDVSMQVHIARAVDLAHAARANRADDLIRAKAGPDV